MEGYIPVFLGWARDTEGLSDAEKGRLIDAMVAYARGEDWQNLIKGNERFVFNVMRGVLDRHFAYLQTQKDKGKLGGRPQKARETQGFNGETPGFQTETTGFTEKPNNNNNNNNNKNENKNTDANASCAESPAGRSTPTPSAYDIPLNDGSTYNVPEENIAVYRKLYPAVDVDQALRNMIGWCMSHERERKTRRGVKAFITGWLTRDQDKAKTQKGGTTNAVDSRPVEEDIFAGLTPEQIALYEQYANDGEHYG